MNRLLKAFSLAAIFLAFAALAPAQAAEAADLPVISVDGEGSARLAPDMATISVGVTTIEKNAAEAQSKNAIAMDSVAGAIKALGVEDKDIQTQNFSFRPNYEYKNGGERRVTGYTANNTLTVKTYDVNLVGKIIDAALKNGATNISSLDFGLKDDGALEREALRLAVANARLKASSIAHALGHEIVGIKSVSESTNGYSGRNFMPLMMAKADSAATMEETTIEPGELTMETSVHIEFLMSK